MAWVVELLDDRVRDELESLPPDMQARFRKIVELIQDTGSNAFTSRTSRTWKALCGKCRMKGQDGIARAVYVTAKGRPVVVVRVFIKKTQKTPRREIEVALQRAQEVQDQ
ncbi:MAG TPA: type II toxin-antitoxin system RelE/ParE family toxin [Bryobacteraceae bacterium]|nr:type II toxin-antitoxin system RelE/ParE family toxin [Bryobacteraceae bacterium]